MKNCMIIILGITGDLSRKKLIPAYYSLKQRNPDTKFILVGAAKEDTDIKTILETAKQYIRNVNEEDFNVMLKDSYYFHLDFTKLDDFKALSSKLNQLETDVLNNFESSNSGNEFNKLIYLACQADFFCPITKNLSLSGIAKNKNDLKSTFNFIVYEKPFGSDLNSAICINKCIAKYFDEDQIFRIDHYLTRSLVNSIALFRFTNAIFEPLWNRDYIDQVQIIFDESISVGSRGFFYDKYGALKDVMQNHMFQLLSLVAMQKPDKLQARQISKAKADVLLAVSVQDGILGQYEGYNSELGISPNSETETFAFLKLMINNDQWKDVPFYLKTGKNLKKKSTEIKIIFKSVDKEIFNLEGKFEPNVLNIVIAPDSSFSLKLNTQKAGDLYKTIPVTMDFCYHCEFGKNFLDSYELLLSEILKSDHSVSVGNIEIENAWKIIDQIKDLSLPLYSYESGSNGPIELEEFIKRNKVYV